MPSLGCPTVRDYQGDGLQKLPVNYTWSSRDTVFQVVIVLGWAFESPVVLEVTTTHSLVHQVSFG